MADKMYAWSKFKLEVNEWGQTGKWLMPGEEVSQDMLKVSDDEWQSLVDSGVVRPEPYPDVPANVPPVQAEKDTVAAAEEAAAEEVLEEKQEEKASETKPNQGEQFLQKKD